MRGRDGLWQLLPILTVLAGLCPQAQGADCIGVVPSGRSAFWQQVEVGAQQAADELGVELYYRGPQREGGVAVQLQLIERIVARGCKALVIAPSGEEIGQRVSELAASGIPTIYIDSDLAGGAALGLVATDNFAAGLQAGQHMAKLLNGKGRVALLRMRRGLHSTGERERGFLQGAQAGGVTLVIDEYVGDDSQLAMRILGDRLTQFDALFTPNSTSSRAVLVAMRRLQKAGQRVHIGFDGDDVLLEALAKGDIHALFIQQPRIIGYQGVKQAHQAMHGRRGETAVHIALDVRLISRANLNELRDTLLNAPVEP